MKKSKYFTLTALACALLITGCSNKTSNDQMMEQLEQKVAHNAAYVGDGNGMGAYNIEATIDGSEEEKIIKVLSDAKIMNAPSSEGTIVGQVRKNENVIILGESSESGWYKIGFNGRVCYIREESLDMQTVAKVEKDDEETKVNDGENNKPSNNTTSSSTNGTAEKPGSTTEKPTVTEKPSTSIEKPGTSTEKPGTSTEKPGTSTEKPSTPTEKPGTSTEEPGTTTEESGTTTEEPGTTTEESPVGPSEKPETTLGDSASVETWPSGDSGQNNDSSNDPWYAPWYDPWE